MFPNKLYYLIISSILISQILCEEKFENSEHICEKCGCLWTNHNTSLTLNCTNKQIRSVLDNWPLDGTYKHLTAIFSYNDINRLESLPTSSAQSLKVVYSHCNIKELDSGLVEASVNVTFLDLSYNQLTSEQLHGDVFKGPYNNSVYAPIVTLKHLNLAYNQIHSINKNLFEHTPNLEELILEGNPIRMIDMHSTVAFTNLGKLQHLNLAGIRLIDLTGDVMKMLKSLTHLDISNNEFDIVPPSLSFANNTLQSLILDNNPIILLDGETFLGTRNLVYLSANNLTKLNDIKTNTFSHLTKLRRLQLSHNSRLSHIDDEAFGSIQSLKQLNLSFNNLTTLPRHMINWTELDVLDLSGNPLYCTCDLLNITHHLNQRILLNRKGGPSCWNPQKVLQEELYSTNNELCMEMVYKLLQGSEEDYFTNFRIMRVGLVTASITLIVMVSAISILLYVKWKTYLRTKSYGFPSQVVYSPVMTDMHM